MAPNWSKLGIQAGGRRVLAGAGRPPKGPPTLAGWAGSLQKGPPTLAEWAGSLQKGAPTLARWAGSLRRWAPTLARWAGSLRRWAGTLGRWAATLTRWAGTLTRWAGTLARCAPPPAGWPGVPPRRPRPPWAGAGSLGAWPVGVESMGGRGLGGLLELTCPRGFARSARARFTFSSKFFHAGSGRARMSASPSNPHRLAAAATRRRGRLQPCGVTSMLSTPPDRGGSAERRWASFT